MFSLFGHRRYYIGMIYDNKRFEKVEAMKLVLLVNYIYNFWAEVHSYAIPTCMVYSFNICILQLFGKSSFENSTLKSMLLNFALARKQAVNNVKSRTETKQTAMCTLYMRSPTTPYKTKYFLYTIYACRGMGVIIKKRNRKSFVDVSENTRSEFFFIKNVYVLLNWNGDGNVAR